MGSSKPSKKVAKRKPSDNMLATSNASAEASARERTTTLPVTRRQKAQSILLDGDRVNPLDDKNDVDDMLSKSSAKKPMSLRDRNAIILLIVLYFIQGIPIGLAFGSIPFLLKSRLSYSQIGVFSLSTYPYSLKLFWSPIVDSVYSRRIGRRKSWIVPIQAIIGSLMYWIGTNSEALLASAENDIGKITFVFTTLVFFAATQDIAVDGWALTLLSTDNLSFASTSQTVGLNTGYFLSFTVFLALNSHEFANKYFRSVPSEVPFLTLGGYLKFCGLFCFIVTLWLLIFKKEDPVSPEEEDMSIKHVYKIMWKICKLKHVQTLCIVHLVAKIGFQANEAVTDLKLMEKGLSKEDLALVVLINFPFEMLGGYFAADWSKGASKLRPWIHGYWVRLVFAIWSMLLVKGFPRSGKGGNVSLGFLATVIVSKVLSSFASTAQFVGISAFHSQISDPVIGGTYMTLLNTVSNLGGTWPRIFVLKGVDWFSVAKCYVHQANADLVITAQECVSEPGKERCTSIGGTCQTEQDGYYAVSMICVALGGLIFISYILPAAKRLQALPLSKWRVNLEK